MILAVIGVPLPEVRFEPRPAARLVYQKEPILFQNRNTTGFVTFCVCVGRE
jgi:hypothetical protein